MGHIEQLVREYGYWAVLVGTFLEGETILIAAGFAAQRGMLSLPLVLLIAAIGATLGDQTYFFLGRHRREWLLRRFPKIREKADRVYRLIEKYPDSVIIISRFIYGIRIPTPILMGTSRVAAWRFSFFNSLGAAIWATLIGGAGYLFGHAIDKVMGHVEKIQKHLILGILAAGLLGWLIHLVVARRRAARKKKAAETTAS